MSRPPVNTPRLLSERAARIPAAALLAVCLMLVGAEFAYEKHPYFGFDGFFGFYALVGFATVIVAVLLARLLRPMIGRHENHYGEADPGIAELDSEGPTDE
ncbi:hypothetical protein [Salinisphaera sp. Q1T1-3]|uniref:hypothetical protein n=1 Tax=Salinisphaera sp. Q1T1-3 TaxID=2321229 RepID=UPI000E76AAF9|nr:hypothetical protein [Salinisphaera sp. Q1T1-3]RJS93127.1 hypothetical protein D3260_09520 [Salinisphaera sp. Q1T1-3]